MARTVEIRDDNKEKMRVSSWNPHQSAWISAARLREWAVRMGYVDAVGRLGDIRAKELRAQGFFEEMVAPSEVFYGNECLRVGIEPRDLTDEERGGLEGRIPDIFDR